MQTYIVHYGELALKGRNRIQFERKLVSNLHRVLSTLGKVQVERAHSYLIVKAAEDIAAEALEQSMRRVFGIAYFAPTTVVPCDLAAITQAALHLADGVITPQTTFRIETKRGDKQFPIKSYEVNEAVGARVVAATQAPVKLKNPDVTLNIQIYPEATYLFIQRIPGAGGLPVGISGRVLTLLSGGIDSPVAAHLLLKRGCTTHFLHFHLLPTTERARESKIIAMARAILAPHRRKARLHLVSAAPFESAMATTETRVATVVFRRFVMRVAEHIARQDRALALVTGESVGQVASQTLKNIHLIARATPWPVFRPLIGMDKEEIVDLAKDIGTYELSIQPYKDPCSMHIRKPATWAKQAEVLAVEKQIGLDDLVEETLARHVDTVRISWPSPEVK